MAYDEDLADRIRELVAAEPGVDEKHMFGGLAFLVGGNLAVAASGRGGLMVRVTPDAAESLIARVYVAPMEMRGSTLRGWLRVESEGVRTRRDLTAWVGRGLAAARALPPKDERTSSTVRRKPRGGGPVPRQGASLPDSAPVGRQ